MSAIGTSSATPTVLPEQFAVAQKLVSRILRRDIDVEKVKTLFSEHAIFTFLGHSKTPGQFFYTFVQRNVSSLQRMGSWSDEYTPSRINPNQIAWSADGFQYCAGNGFRESSEGWYHLKQRIAITLVSEDARWKILEFHIISYDKSKILADTPIEPLPHGQHLVHKLAHRWLKIPRLHDSITKLYDPFAVIIYPNGKALGMYEFQKKLEKSIQGSFTTIGSWKNTYTPIYNARGDLTGVQWIAEGCEKCLEIRQEKWYKIVKIVTFTFREHKGSVKIANQSYFSFTRNEIRSYP